jgi:hypothetical protein
LAALKSVFTRKQQSDTALLMETIQQLVIDTLIAVEIKPEHIDEILALIPTTTQIQLTRVKI